MGYNIEVGKPPNFEEILKVFPKAKEANVVFAYYPNIYVSHPAVVLSAAIIDHECVHLQRQKEAGVEAWWSKYLSDKEFCYAEELLAHKAEYKKMMSTKNGRAYDSALVVAKKLVAPLYGFDKSLQRALSDITERRLK